ncbi:MAG: rod shape-determining protein MreD [Phycisphaerae bacterium]
MSRIHFPSRRFDGILSVMRWITFFLLLYFATALQAAHLAQWSEFGYFHIEYIFMLAVFYALFAEKNSALLAGFWCGLMYDLTGQSLVGLEAIVAGMIALGIVSIRMHIFRTSVLGQMVITFFAVLAFLAGRLVLTHLALVLAGRPVPITNVLGDTGIILSSSLYTAVVAPWVFKALFLLGDMLGLEPQHHRGIVR